MIASATDRPETDLARFLRRRALGDRTLSLPVEVFPDERLDDLLFRAAAENGYFTTKVIVDMLGGDARYDRVTRTQPFLWIDRGALNDVLGLTSNETCPPFETIVRRGVQTFFGTTIRETHLTSQIRFSPLGLKEAPYVRAVWRIRSLTFDPVTREHLLERCPNCDSLFSNTYSVGLPYCRVCTVRGSGDPRDYDIRGRAQKIVEVEDCEGLDFAARLIDPRSFGSEVHSRLHSDFSSLERGEIFYFVTLLAHLIVSFGNTSGTVAPKGLRRKPSIGDPIDTSVLAEAGRIALDWPWRFKDLVSRIREARPGQTANVFNFFRFKGFEANFTKSIGRMICDEKRSFRAREILELPRGPTTNSTDNVFGRAMAAFNKGSPRLEFKVLSSLLTSGTEMVGKAQVELTTLRQKPQIHTLARRLGIPTYEIRNMVRADLLPPYLIDLTNNDPVAGSSRFIFETVLQNRSSAPKPERIFSLATVMNAFCIRLEQPWSALFRAIIDGELEFWFSDSVKDSLFRSIMVRDLELVRALIASVPQSDDTVREICVSNSDAAATLAVPMASIPDFAKFGVLNSPTTIGQLHSIRSKYVSPGEISPRLFAAGSSWSSAQGVSSELRKGGVPSLTEPPLALRLRADVEEYFGRRIVSCIYD